ncbi:MAG: response regulator [Gammaproteobacteria bacterium]|nr:response regulator [Gammaproteobacteria bacterium]
MSEPMVFIVDDDCEVRAALQLLMGSIGLQTAVFESALHYLNQFDPSQAGCLVLDIRMPGMSGLELQSVLNEKPLHPPIVMVTGHGDVPMAVRAVKAGALDFIEKPFSDQVLLDSVHRAIEQDAQQRGEASRVAEITVRLARLTPRERQVMEHVVAGLRNKVIAVELKVSLSTVEAHRARVMEKMEVKSLSELMRIMLSLQRN